MLIGSCHYPTLANRELAKNVQFTEPIGAHLMYQLMQ